MKGRKDRIGNIIRIKIDDNTFAYGRVIDSGFLEFYDPKIAANESGDGWRELAGSKPIFTLSVHKSWKKNENWVVVGNEPRDVPGIPSQFMQNIADPSDIKIIDFAGQARPASIEEVQGIERLAVWEDNHVEDRLRDHRDGRPNVWAEQLKPKRPS